MTYNTFPLSCGDIVYPSSHLALWSFIQAASFVIHGTENDDMDHMGFVLAVVWLSENLDEQYHHDGFDRTAFIAILSEAIADSPRLMIQAGDILSADLMDHMITVAQVTALPQIIGLTEKYRHSHTLRRDFCRKYSVIYPTACAYLEACLPEKANRTLHRPWVDMEGLEESALFIFLHGQEAFLKRLTSDLPEISL